VGAPLPLTLLFAVGDNVLGFPLERKRKKHKGEGQALPAKERVDSLPKDQRIKGPK